MANVAAVLKAEIIRLSQKAIRQYLAPLAIANKAHRKEIASLKVKVASLEREFKRLQRVATPGLNKGESRASDSTKYRFTAKGLITLRSRLGLSAEDFGKLIGASGQSVYKWESQRAMPRQAQVQKIAAVRSIGKREALAQLAVSRKA